MEDGIDRMEKKARRHGETRRYNRRGGNTKGLIEIEIFDEGIIDKFLIQEGTKVPVGTVMALLQPSGVSLDTKKEKRSCPIATNRRKTIKVRHESTAEIRKIKVSPLARRIAEENHIRLESVKGTGDGAITKEMSIT
jgi:pyruvate dehydrogenase E2 component (dihydrolipoamide acetyltransferase)